MLWSFLRNMVRERKLIEIDNPSVEQHQIQRKRVLNVGGNDKRIPIPQHYDQWDHVMLDIDPKGLPDVVCDARELVTLPASEYDSIYCSHNLEHYYRHDVPKVLAGFLHVLKNEGFVYIRVPDMGELMRKIANEDLDISDFLYQSPAGPITVMDVIYGYGDEIERTGHDFFAHKTGFTEKSLNATLTKAGFPHVFSQASNLEITAIGFIDLPSDEQLARLNISETKLA